MKGSQFHNPEIVLGASVILIKQLCELTLQEAQQQDLTSDLEKIKRAERQAKLQSILRPKRERIGMCLGHVRIFLWQLRALQDEADFKSWALTIAPVLEYLGSQVITNETATN